MFDGITLGNLHCRLESDVIGCDNGHRTDRWSVVDFLLRRVSDRKIESFDNPSHGGRSPLFLSEVGACDPTSLKQKRPTAVDSHRKIRPVRGSTTTGDGVY